MNDKKEIKKPAINTFNQGNYNNSLLIKTTENLQTPLVKQPVLSVPKQTISLSSTFPSSSSTASSYVSPYKRPSTSTTSLQNSKLVPLTKINSGINILKEIPNTSSMISNSKLKKLGPGVLYIFHHDIFKDSSTKYREGSQHDVQILKKTFTKFNVKNFVYENYTVSNIQKIMKRVSNQNFKKNSCIVFAILSHGNRMDQIAAYDGNYSINDDILFQVIKNEDLRGKPKILIVQACKGSFDIRNFDTDEADSNTHGKVNPGVPDEIYKFYSTCEGFVSFRNSTGSVFIQQFCSALENYGEKKNIKEIMELTIQKVKDQTGNKQIPSMCVNNTVPYIFGDYK
ncbi:caspase-3-like [Condylostylus longicornis]|uniref:caspase-3-like n=1 Tax=Condylostylus longicornis TaxID=2530218 RepID=UPI00244DE5E6|nr:caspase-3-like [Condylostylus longicornis]